MAEIPGGAGALEYAPTGYSRGGGSGVLNRDPFDSPATARAAAKEIQKAMKQVSKATETQPNELKRALLEAAEKRLQAKENKDHGHSTVPESSRVPDAPSRRPGRPKAATQRKGRGLGVQLPHAARVPQPRRQPASRSDDQAQVQEMGAAGDAESLGSAGLSPGEINLDFFEKCDIDEGLTLYNRFYDTITAVGRRLEARRTAAAASTCNFCGEMFGDNYHEYGIFQYENPPGSRVIASIRTCRQEACVKQYEAAVSEINKRNRRQA